MQRVPTSVVLRALRTPLESHHRPATMLATTTTPFASRATRTSSKTAARVVASARRSSTASSPSPSSLPKIVANASPFLPRASGRDETGDPSPSSSQQQRGGEDEPDRDEDGLYIGTYSNFFTDPDQIKGGDHLLRVSRVVPQSREHRRGDIVTDLVRPADTDVHPGHPVRVLLPAVTAKG